MTSPVRQSAEFIVAHAEHVSVSRSHAAQVASQLLLAAQEGQFDLKHWKEHTLHPSTMDSKALQWVFLIDTLNFSFWPRTNNQTGEEEYFEVEWPTGTFHTGYWSLCAALQRAIEGPNPLPLLDANFLSNIDLPTVKKIFRSSNGVECPLLEERTAVLREAGSVLLKHFDGKVENIVRASNNSAVKFIKLVTSHFSSYQDEAEFHGKTVYLWKRVQILVADIWACFEGEGYGSFSDIDQVTMFADYRVPQILNFLGILQYDEYLFSKLQADPFLVPKCDLEIELRGGSIWSVEVLKEEMRKLSPEVSFNSIMIDFYLWDQAKADADKMKEIPIHKTKTIFY